MKNRSSFDTFQISWKLSQLLKLFCLMSVFSTPLPGQPPRGFTHHFTPGSLPKRNYIIHDVFTDYIPFTGCRGCYKRKNIQFNEFWGYNIPKTQMESFRGRPSLRIIIKQHTYIFNICKLKTKFKQILNLPNTITASNFYWAVLFSSAEHIIQVP